MKLGSSLPKDDRNGLDALTGPVLRDPAKKHVILALVDARAITTDVDTGAEIPTLRIHAIEAFARDSEMGRELRRIWRQTWEDRTGNGALPLDIREANDPDPDDK